MGDDDLTLEKWMEQISSLYRENRSLKKTAEQMGVAYGKVRKVLITLGEYKTPFSLKVTALRQKGLQVSEIADILGVSEKRINAFLPYEKSVYNAPDLTIDAKKSKRYRKRIETAAQNIVGREYGKKNPEKVMKESLIMMEKEQGTEKKEIRPIRLHLELQNEYCTDEEARVLSRYADATDRGLLTRDILIPSDMPLHNLHYTIQRLYGWQNSHLRCFRLDEQDYDRLVRGQVKGWMDLVGILFKGLTDNSNDEFWDEDYTGGSFKVWLKNKYSGPYSYGGNSERHQVAKDSIRRFVEHFPVIDVRESFHEYRERTKEMGDPKNEPYLILKKAPVLEVTLKELHSTINLEAGTSDLLERLEVISVLASHTEPLADADELGQRIVIPEYETNHGNYKGVGEPEVLPVTRKIIYNYDYGDDWNVEIIRKDDCYDLLQAGAVTEEGLKQAQQIVVEKHKPVCISKKGGYVVDDVGGIHGYANFLSTIYESEDREERADMRWWAEDLGWSNRKVSVDRML